MTERGSPRDRSQFGIRMTCISLKRWEMAPKISHPGTHGYSLPLCSWFAEASHLFGTACLKLNKVSLI